jgi:hypothetical protein
LRHFNATGNVEAGRKTRIAPEEIMALTPPVMRPEITNLVFHAYDRPIHPELIDPLRTRCFERDGYLLRLSLTSAGHVMEWRWPNVTIVEMLSDCKSPLPETGELFSHRIGHERSEMHRPTKSVSYQTCFQVEKLSFPIFRHVHNELRQGGERNGVLHLIQPHDRLGLSPMSFVDLQARQGSLILHVYHTFPDEQAVVKIQTLIELTE